MSLRQTVYFMTLVGGIAGLGCWLIQAILAPWLSTLPSDYVWLSQVLQLTLLGALVAGMTVGFADHWSADRFLLRWALIGAALGAAAGLLSAVISLLVFDRLVERGVDFVGRVIIWALTGGLIGLATGLRWFGVNRLRAVHALIGGLVGGAGGGLVYATLATEQVFQALALVLMGLGITLGVTAAPVLLRDGVLRFISSADPRAQNKYASPRQEWVVQSGDRLVIGSLGARMTATVYSPTVQIYLPDALVAPMHAILFEQQKRFFVQAHPDNLDRTGQPVAPLLVNDSSVSGRQEIRDGDELLVGQTVLTFLTVKSRIARSQTMARQASGVRR